MDQKSAAKVTPKHKPVTPTTPELASPFSRNLYKIMVSKGMNASDLAAIIWGKKTSGNGYTAAKNRDRISVYLRGRSVPSKENLVKIAQALDVTPESLEYNPAHKMGRPPPDLSLVVEPDNSDMVRLALNMVLPTTIALEITRLVADARKARDAHSKETLDALTS